MRLSFLFLSHAWLIFALFECYWNIWGINDYYSNIDRFLFGYLRCFIGVRWQNTEMNKKLLFVENILKILFRIFRRKKIKYRKILNLGEFFTIFFFCIFIWIFCIILEFFCIILEVFASIMNFSFYF